MAKKPDYAFWMAKQTITLAEAACLCNGIEPCKTEAEFDALLRSNPKVHELFYASVAAVRSGDLPTQPQLDS